jgi:hypothetical protein
MNVANNEIAPTKFLRGQTGGARDLVHLSFERKDTLWSAETAKSPVRRMIRCDSAAADAHIRAIVWPGSMNRPS